MANRNSIEQGRAAFAYLCAEEGSKLKKRKEYKSYVKKLPMYIKTNGVGAAVAFAFSKGAKNGVPNHNDPWGLIYQQLENWLSKDEKKLIGFSKDKLAKALAETDSYTYRYVTIELLSFLGWLRRFSEALIDGESE